MYIGKAELPVPYAVNEPKENDSFSGDIQQYNKLYEICPAASE